MADSTLNVGQPGYGPAASSRLARLATARVSAQALGFLWFIYAARSLPPAELGLLSSGLALVVVIGGLGDLGTTRTVVRHVAARPGSLRANLARALRLRIGAGAVLGAVATVLLPLVSQLRPATVGLAAWIATASGATEVDFAALRSIGSAKVEVRILVVERTAFTILAVSALWFGAGPFVVLALYGATNTASAVLGAAAGLRMADGGLPAGPYLDAEGRHTALSTSLLIVAPRASMVVLVLLGSAPAVAAFAVAQKPSEALSLLVLALAAPALPILRAKVVAGADRDAALVAGRVAAAGLAVCGGVLGWLAADPHGALSLLLGEGSDLGGATTLRLLAVAASLAVVRGALELLVLAGERAGQLARATGVALVVTVVVSVALVDRHGATGAGWGALAGEATALLLVLIAALRLAHGTDLLRPVVGSAALAAATAGVVAAADQSAVTGLLIAIVASAVGGVLAHCHVRALDGSAAAGPHSDVGQQPRGHDI